MSSVASFVSRLRVAALALALATAVTAIAAPARAAEIIPTAGEPVTLELNKGHMVRIDRPAAAVFISNPDIAQVAVKTPRLIYVFAKKAGEASLYAVDQNENVVANISIVISHDVTRLQKGLDAMVPQGQVQAISVDGAIILTGAVATETEAEDARRLAARYISDGEEVINRLAVTAPNQVNLRVRIAEVSRSLLRQFGINWDALADVGDFTFGLATGNPLFDATGTRITRAGTPPVNNVFGDYNGNDVDINGLIDLLAEDDLISILAEPNLTALSGETASFLAGGEFPVPVPDDDGIAIEFKDFGVGLAFTPTVLSGNRISLKVNPEVSQLSTEGAVVIETISVPSLTIRRAETTVELGSGQSFAIAGLLQDTSTFDHSRTPGLGDIPILGELFKSERFNRQETELVIIVTPYVVKPISDPSLIATPVDAISSTGPQRLALQGQQAPAGSAVPAATTISPDPGLTGQAGFVIE